MDVTTNFNGANIAAVQNRPIQATGNAAGGVERAARRFAPERPGATQVGSPNSARLQEANATQPWTTMREENVTEAMLERAFEDANRALSGGSFSLSYRVHEGSSRIMVTVHEARSREVLREIPMESRLDIYARITEFVGLLFDQGN